MIDSYIKYLRNVRRYSQRTCEVYRDSLERFERWTVGEEGGKLDAKDLNVNAIRNWEVWLMDDCAMNAKTTGLHLSILSGFCRFLIKAGKLKSNPALLVKRPRTEKRLPVFYREDAMEKYFSESAHAASREELEIQISAKGTPLEKELYERRLRRLIISLLANTGIRRSELLSLRLDAISFSRSSLRVRGKGDKEREIPLVRSLAEEISLYLESLEALQGELPESSGPLLRTAGGKALYPVWVDRAVKKELGDAEGISGQKSPHILRHTIATELLSDGSDINSIKEMLGHSSLAATQVYTHNSIERLKQVYRNAHPRAGEDPQKKG